MNDARTMLRMLGALAIVACALSACISGAPTLTGNQLSKLTSLTVYPLGQTVTKPYTVLADISAADCSGSPMGGRVTGNVDLAMDTFKRKAVAINADSIIDVSCGTAPMVNNCWAAQKCTGRAISFVEASPAAPINK
jgi:hypothetical protein